MKAGYITILDWMYDLGLSSLREVVVYAVIYGFSQDGESTYHGSRKYLMKVAGCSSHHTIDDILTHLVELGLIEKIGREINGVKVCYYRVTDPEGGRAKIAPVGQKLPGGRAKIAHNNKYNNKCTCINTSALSARARKEFVPPTISEVCDYAASRGFADPQGFAAHFIAYYTEGEHPWHLQNGKPMRDWKRAVVNWEPNNKARCFSAPTPNHRPQKGTAPAKGYIDQMQEVSRQADAMLGITPTHQPAQPAPTYDEQ